MPQSSLGLSSFIFRALGESLCDRFGFSDAPEPGVAAWRLSTAPRSAGTRASPENTEMKNTSCWQTSLHLSEHTTLGYNSSDPDVTQTGLFLPRYHPRSVLHLFCLLTKLSILLRPCWVSNTLSLSCQCLRTTSLLSAIRHFSVLIRRNDWIVFKDTGW